MNSDDIELGAIAARLNWRACTPEYAAKVGPHEYVVRGKTISDADWQTFADAIDQDGEWRSWSPPGAPEVVSRYRYVVLDDRRYWRFDTVLNRCRNR
jgi:hypothetical protein